MSCALSILSIFSHVLSHNYEAIDVKTFFAQGFNIQTTDRDLSNKWVIYRFHKYGVSNAKDYDF